MGTREYGGIIWTNHALDRLLQRGLRQDLAWQTFKNPDKTTQKTNGIIEHYKRFDTFYVTVLAKQNEKKEWIVISCWMDPPVEGSIDWKKQQDYKRYKKASFWGKLFLTLKKQIGL